MQLLGASSDSKAPDVALREFCSDLLISLFEDHRAESAFFLLRPPPEPADRTLVPLQVVAAHSAGGERLEHPDYHLDHHYLRDIAALDGAHHLAGAEEGISRPLLSCSFALIDDVRGVVLLEGSPGGDSLADEDAEKLEESVAAVVEDLRALYRISEQAQKIERLSSQLEELAGLLDQKELELGGIRRTLEEERFLGEEVTCYHRILT
ncbi:MAG: hypothetical protein ACE5GW_08455, partial [Planctomycetota bacterium]